MTSNINNSCEIEPEQSEKYLLKINVQCVKKTQVINNTNRH